MNDFLKLVFMSLIAACLASLVSIGFEGVNNNSFVSDVSSSMPTPTISSSSEIISSPSSGSNNQTCTINTQFGSIEDGKFLYGRLSRDPNCGDQARSVCSDLQLVWDSQSSVDSIRAKLHQDSLYGLCSSFGGDDTGECTKQKEQAIIEIEENLKQTQEEIKNFCQKY